MLKNNPRTNNYKILQDVAHFKLNAMSGQKPQLSANSKIKLESFNWADYLLYNYFKKRLYAQVKKIGVNYVYSVKQEIVDLSNQLKSECAQTAIESSIFILNYGYNF